MLVPVFFSICSSFFVTVYVGTFFFFFKQKTAYEITTGDWSSDVCSSDLERRQVGGVAGHAVDAVHADEARGVALGAQQLVEVVRVLEAEALDGGAAGAGGLAAVIDRLVRAGVEEDRARGGEQRDHRHVDVRDRRQDERVLAAEQLGQALLDLLVEDRAAEQARPARVR